MSYVLSRSGAWQSHAPGWRDGVALLLVLGGLVLLGAGAQQMVAPFPLEHPPAISLSPWRLPFYTFRTVLRLLAGLMASLLFTFTYATLAAKSERARKVLIPLLDVLQSVPVLGYLSFTAVFFISLAPGSAIGPELTAIFAIFTSQAWNMAFSFYQALRTVPADLDEASRSLRASPWQRFWQLEVPFAIPSLVWNMMMSLSGAWFFVVASEAITVGSLHVALPGVGSYVERAIEERDLTAVGWAIVAMTVAIVLYDQLLFRPLVAWSDKFHCGETASQAPPRSWVLDLLRRSPVLAPVLQAAGAGLHRLAGARLGWAGGIPRPPRLAVGFVWYGLLGAGLAWLAWELAHVAGAGISWADIRTLAVSGALTLLRVCVLIALASLLWVPVGVAVGLKPRWAQRVQPLAQFLAAFPANLLFPVAVFLILTWHLSPGLWLSPLMILGTQWYILFNVIAGASAFPHDLKEAARSLRLRRTSWWRKVILPGIFPYYVTGAITASGGAWNASIVSEAVSWGSIHLSTPGLGSYIAAMSTAGDYRRIALGVAAMSLLVVAMNSLLWRPLYGLAERRARLE